MSSSHHGAFPDKQPDSEIMKRFLEQMEGRAKREYSAGRLKATDDGDLAMAITADKANGVVVIDFGKQVTWIGLGPAECVNLAEMLISKAKEISSEPITLNI